MRQAGYQDEMLPLSPWVGPGESHSAQEEDPGHPKGQEAHDTAASQPAPEAHWEAPHLSRGLLLLAWGTSPPQSSWQPRLCFACYDGERLALLSVNEQGGTELNSQPWNSQMILIWKVWATPVLGEKACSCGGWGSPSSPEQGKNSSWDTTGVPAKGHTQVDLGWWQEAIVGAGNVAQRLRGHEFGSHLLSLVVNIHL